LNRYERKKDIPLAIKACANLDKPATLVIAGGYDERVLENVDHHLELVNLSKKLKIKVIFLRSITSQQKVALLQRTDILLYTP
jgi:alpha-1,3/alpha-1,6-mannosyltransferase